MQIRVNHRDNAITFLSAADQMAKNGVGTKEEESEDRSALVGEVGAVQVGIHWQGPMLENLKCNLRLRRANL